MTSPFRFSYTAHTHTFTIQLLRPLMFFNRRRLFSIKALPNIYEAVWIRR